MVAQKLKKEFFQRIFTSDLFDIWSKLLSLKAEFLRRHSCSPFLGRSGLPPCRINKLAVCAGWGTSLNDIIHGRYAQLIAFNGTHLDKCTLRICLVVSNFFCAGQRKKLRVFLQYFLKFSDKLGHFNCLANLVFCYPEKLSYNFPCVVPLANFAKGFSCGILLTIAILRFQESFIGLSALNDGQILSPEQVRGDCYGCGTLIISLYNFSFYLRPIIRSPCIGAVVPSQNFIFILIGDSTNYDSFKLTLGRHMLRQSLQFRRGIGLEPYISGEERAQFADWQFTHLWL